MKREKKFSQNILEQKFIYYVVYLIKFNLSSTLRELDKYYSDILYKFFNSLKLYSNNNFFLINKI